MSMVDHTTSQAAIELREIILNRMRYAATQIISGEVVDQIVNQMRVDVSNDVTFFVDDIIIGFVTDILTDKLPPERISKTETVTTDFPASPWQHFKQLHPTLCRFFRPVRYLAYKKSVTLHVDLTRYRTFPNPRFAYPRDLGPVVLRAETGVTVEWLDDGRRE